MEKQNKQQKPRKLKKNVRRNLIIIMCECIAILIAIGIYHVRYANATKNNDEVIADVVGELVDENGDPIEDFVEEDAEMTDYAEETDGEIGEVLPEDVIDWDMPVQADFVGELEGFHDDDIFYPYGKDDAPLMITLYAQEEVSDLKLLSLTKKDDDHFDTKELTTVGKMEEWQSIAVGVHYLEGDPDFGVSYKNSAGEIKTYVLEMFEAGGFPMLREINK